MKQNISVEQLNELSDKGKEKLRKWWKPEVGDLNQDGHAYVVSHKSEVFKKTKDFPLLSIGQMIEFLEDKKWKENLLVCKPSDSYTDCWMVADLKLGVIHGGYGRIELADALWEACKGVLNEKN